MEASQKATQGVGRYVVCDVTDLTCCSRRLNTVLIGISLTYFKKWMPTSGSLNRNAMNNLFALAPSVARPNVVHGTFGFSWRRRWYVSITEVTRVFVIIVIIFQFLLERQNYVESEHNTTRVKKVIDTVVRRED